MTKEERVTNRKYWIWFLITLFIALLPWFISAQDTAASNKEKNHPNEKAEKSTNYCQAAW